MSAAPTGADRRGFGTVAQVAASRQFRQHRFAPGSGACEILLVRHGESAPAVHDEPFPLKDGHGDPPLSDDGRWQAERLADRLAGERVDAVYVTSLRRTHETAAPLAARLGLSPVEEPDLREVHLGEWEGGLLRQKAAEQDPVALAMFTEERWDVIPGAESHDQLRARVAPAVDRIAGAHPDGRVVVVVHGGIIGSILSWAAESRPFAFVGADNASISHLVVHQDRWLVRRFNDTGHLAGDLSTAPRPLT